MTSITKAARGSISERVWEFGFSFSPAVHGWAMEKKTWTRISQPKQGTSFL
jgi:hypothetical protein